MNHPVSRVATSGIKTILPALCYLFLLPPLCSISSAQNLDRWGRTQSPFVNWENPHVHPLDMTPDESTLVAVNTPDNSLLVFQVTGNTPVHIAKIPVGLDPVSVRARSNTEVWVVNHASDSVSVVDIFQQRVIATLSTGDEPADVVFAGFPQKAFVTGSQANCVHVFDPNNRGLPPNKILINGEDPRALAVSPDGLSVYVGIFESGNGTTAVTGGKSNSFEVDLVRHAMGPYGGIDVPPNDGQNYRPSINPNIPAPPPVSVIVRDDGNGGWIDDNGADWSRMISGDLAGLGGTRGGRVEGWSLPDRDVAIIDAQSLAVRYQSRLMNAIMALDVHPITGDVTVVGTDATNEVRWQPNLQSTFLRVQMSRFDAAGAVQTFDLNPHLDYSVRTIPRSERTRAIGDPRGIAWNQSGTRAYITGMGSNNVIAVDESGQRVARVSVGEGATGIVLQEQRQRAYVLNKFEASISVIGLDEFQEQARVAFFDPTPAAIKKGRRHLYDTHATSGLGHTSCASCHIDARTDRLAWDLGDPTGAMTPLRGFSDRSGNPVVDVEQHPMKGPMLTQTLQDIIGHPSMHWSGDRLNLEGFTHAFVDLQGADAELSEPELDEFEVFLDSIHIPSNPYRELDNNYSTSVQIPGPHGTIAGVGNADIGRQRFESSCRRCHPGHSARGNLIRDGGGFGVELIRRAPTWRNFHERFGLWFKDATASNSGFGFQQDGTFDSTHNQSRSDDLMAFMLSFNGRFPYQPTGDEIGNRSKDTHAAVGLQQMLGDFPNEEEAARLALLFSLADASEIGLVVTGHVNGESRGYTYLGDGQFQSDRQSETVSLTQLHDFGASDRSLVYLAVPAGSEVRIGIDRDLDGFLNQDEKDRGANPSDPLDPFSNRFGALENVAGLGTATQSSDRGDLHAGLAIDGDLGSFTHTATGQSPANWTLTFDQDYLIAQINLHNRASCCQSRLRDITVFILDQAGRELFKSHFLNRHNRKNGPSILTLDITEIAGAPIQGSQIRIVRTPDPLLLGTDGQGNADEPDVLSLAEVEVMACVSTTTEATLTSFESDSEENPEGRVTLRSTDLDLTEVSAGTQTIGIRFQDVSIPQNASILNARVEFVADLPDTRLTELTIYAEAADDAEPFSSRAGDLSRRTKTGASVRWTDIPAWEAGSLEVTPDLTRVIQAIVSRPGWQSDQSVALLITGTGRRRAVAFDGDPSLAPRLVVTFASSTDNRAPVVDPVEDQAHNTGEVIQLTMQGSDPDGDPLSWSAVLPPGLTIDEDRGVIEGTLSQAGTYAARVSATDGQFTGTVTFDWVVSGGSALEIRIAESHDDAEEFANGSMSRGNADLEMADDRGTLQTVGLRFPLNVARGAIIREATIQFTADERSSSLCQLVIRGEDQDDAAPISSSDFDLTSRSQTSASVSWAPPSWRVIDVAGPEQLTPNIASILQEIIDRPGWQPGHRIMILITGTGRRTAESYNGAPAAAPLLRVEFDE